ncbi:putative reverse transcriptase domain-containing protein, partial [Tanacetum coccineum]
MNMILQSSIKDRILAAQKEAVDEFCRIAKRLRLSIKGHLACLQQPEIPVWKWEGIAMDFVTKLPRTSSGQVTKSKANRSSLDMSTAYHPQTDGQKVENGPVDEKKLSLVQETTEKISQIKDRLKAVRDHQKSYADKRRKPLELVKVMSFTQECRLGKVLVPLGRREKFVKPMEILEREFKKLKHSRIAVVKVQWNLKRGPEFTWEREDQMKLKYPLLFSDIMPPRIRTQSAGRPAIESLGGGTGERVSRGGRSRRLREGNDELIEDLNGQGNNQGLGANGGVEEINRNENVGNVLVNGNRVGYSYKEFLACNHKEYDGKGGAVVLTRWIEKTENVQDMSGCSNDQKVKYTAGLFVEFCPSHEMQKLESELWNHAIVEAGHVAYTDKFHELARLVPHLVTPESRMIERYMYGLALQIYEMVAATEPKTMQKAVQISGALTDEAVRNGSIKKVEKRGNVGEPSKDKNGRDDNKRTRTGNAFATTVIPIERENTGTWPKCTTCNSYYAPGGPCRTCFNCNRLGHLARDCRGVLRNVNPVNARNLMVRACYECGSIDHVRSACPRLNRAQEPEGNCPNQVAANNRGQDRGNQGNQAR